ncbi:MAG TPA: GDSL-type esterase/lipase family protein [Solirubrobacteraceae bacterium]|nr:GDSL-type esterase/lipase family protein [Solirubrobacteraceae bacterium]
MGARRRQARVAAAALAAALAACLLAAPAATARRVTVAVVGDSVEEGYTVQDYADNFASVDPARVGLTPVLRDALAARAGTRPGRGFVPMHPALWRFAGAWLHTGYDFGGPGPIGASGYGSQTDDPTATATIAVSEPQVALLYQRSPDGGAFTVTAGGRTWRIDTRADRSDGAGETWLRVPTGARTLTVGGPVAGGTLRFLGLIARRPAPGAATQYEVSNLAHAGRRTGEDLTPANAQAFTRLGIDVTVLLSGTVDEMTADYIGGDRWEAEFAAGLRTRARDARRTGRCIVVPPPPLPVAQAIQRSFFAVERRVARQEGCAFAPVLARVWRTSAASVARGLTHEGIHPTASGYGRMARALVPVVERIAAKKRREALGVRR